MKNTLRALLYGTTILAGLAVLAGSAPAQQLNAKAANGLQSRVLLTTPMLGRHGQNYRKRSTAMRASDFSRQRKPAHTRRASLPSLGVGVTLSPRGSLDLGQAQFSPGQFQKPRTASRNLKKPLAATPPIQLPAVDLGMTPAGKKIEALRDKLGLESIAAVEGAGPAPGRSTSGTAPADATSAAGVVNSGLEASPAHPANDCIGSAGDGLPNPHGNAETGPGRRVPSSRIHRLMRDIAEGVGWAPGLRPNSFHNDDGVWHGRSSDDHETDVIQGPSGITIAIYNRDEGTTTRYVYDRNEAGAVKLNRTQIEYGPDSSEPGTVETHYPDTSPGHGNTITRTRRSDPQDSQPTEAASEGVACGEAAVRHEQEEAERKRNAPIRFRDPGPDGPSGVVTKPDDPPTQEEIDDMTCQSSPDGDECHANRGGGRPRRAQDFAQPAIGVDGSVVPGLSGEEAPGEATGELIDPRPDGDPDAMAGR